MKRKEREADWAWGAIRLHADLTVSAGPVKRAGAETACERNTHWVEMARPCSVVVWRPLEKSMTFA